MTYKNRFHEKLSRNRRITAIFVILGFAVSITGAIFTSNIFLFRDFRGEIQSLWFADVLKVSITFLLSWVIFSNLMRNIDVLLAKTEKNEFKIYRDIMDIELKKAEDEEFTYKKQEQEIQNFRKS